MARYVVRTDGVMDDTITARSMDQAARKFAAEEYPGRRVTGVRDLFDLINRIGDGAWCWIQGPEGRRDSRD